MAAPHHHFMLTRIANAHAQDARPEMNMLLKKRIFYSFAFFVSFLSCSIFFFRCPPAVHQAFSV
jgi:hypothetical protein